MLRKRDVGQTVIGQGTVIQGTLRVEGSIHIDGRVEGGVEAEQMVSIGPKGVIVGELKGSQEVIVGGLVEGQTTVKGHLHVRSGGTVRGEVIYQSMEIAKGGAIEGRSRTLDQAATGARMPTEGEKNHDVSGTSVRPPMLVRRV